MTPPSLARTCAPRFTDARRAVARLPDSGQAAAARLPAEGPAAVARRVALRLTAHGLGR